MPTWDKHGRVWLDDHLQLQRKRERVGIESYEKKTAVHTVFFVTAFIKMTQQFLVVRLHHLVVGHIFSKVRQSGRVAPWLLLRCVSTLSQFVFEIITYPDLCLDSAGKAAGPFHARMLLGDLLDDILVH